MDTFIYNNSNTSTLDNSIELQHVMEDVVDNLTEKQLAEQLNEEFQEVVLPVTVFVGFEVILGFLGNSIVLYVFLFHYHVCNFRYFVLCLAFIDITSSLTTMPGEIVTQMNWYVYPQREVCKVKSFFNIFTASAEALCLLAIAVDRYRKVCRPLKWQITPRRAIYVCGIIYLVAFVVSLPVAFFWGLHSHPKVYRGVTINVTICEKDEQYKDTKHPLIYSLTVEIMFSACLLVMLVLYILVAKKLLQEKRKPNSSGSPMVVITPAPDTDAPSGDNTTYTHSEMSDTGYSSGIYNKPVPKKEIQGDCITSDDETEHKEKSTTLTVPVEIRGSQASINNVRKQASHRCLKPPRDKMNISARVRRKTLIMFILTVTFIATTVLYLTLLSLIARSDNVLQEMSHSGKAAYFFFFRLYFLNHVINPVVYGLLDPRFRKVMRHVCSAK